MGRYGWLLVVGVVLLGALGWFGAGKTLAEDDTRLGPPVVVPTPTAVESHPESSDEPTLDSSQSPTSPPPDSNNSAGTPNGAGSSDAGHSSSKARDASADSHGADRIKPGPPRTAGDDDDDDDDDDHEDADDDDHEDADDHDDEDEDDDD